MNDLDRIKGDKHALLAVLGASDARDLAHIGCPFHEGGREEKTGSLSVSQKGNAWLFRCHKCTAAGSIVDAVALAERCNKSEAVRIVIEQFGDATAAQPTPERKCKPFPTLEALLKCLTAQGWQIDGQWDYLDAAGQIAFKTFRVSRDGRKQFRPAHQASDGWHMRMPEGPRPLYRHPEVAARPGERILAVEGEKCADRAAALGFLTVTSAGGSKSADKTDWSATKGRDLLICPDNDDDGREYARRVLELALDAGARSVRIAELPGLEPACDIADFIEGLRTEGKEDAAITESIKAALHWDDPAPDMRRGPRTLREWLESEELRRPVPRLTTGFPDLDKALDGGLALGSLYILAGVTGHGKTTLGENLLRRAGLASVQCLYLALEPRAIPVVRNLQAASARVPVRALERMRGTAQEREALDSARPVLNDLPIVIDQDTAELKAIELLVEAFSQQGTKFVIIDQVSWIRLEADSPYQRASEISRRLALLAQSANVVVLALHQINREPRKKDDEPQLFHMRDSGTFENDAAGVFIIKSVIDAEHGIAPSILTIGLDKHRHGPQGSAVRVRFSWFKPEHLIESWTPADVTGVQV